MEQKQMTQEELVAYFNTRMAQFEAELSRSASTSSPVASKFASFKNIIDALFNHQQQIEGLARQVDTLEMRTRRKMLLFHGVPEEKQEETAVVLSKAISDHLKLPDFTKINIRRCHRMGRSAGGNHPRTIAVKFETAAVRDQIWFAKTKLKGSGITVSEFLTKHRHEIFMAARERFGVTRCWTREGIIYISADSGTKHRITTMSELNNIERLEKDPEAQAASKASSRSRRAMPKK